MRKKNKRFFSVIFYIAAAVLGFVFLVYILWLFIKIGGIDFDPDSPICDGGCTCQPTPPPIGPGGGGGFLSKISASEVGGGGGGNNIIIKCKCCEIAKKLPLAAKKLGVKCAGSCCN